MLESRVLVYLLGKAFSSHFRPLNFLSLNWYKKVGSSASGNRTKIVADNIKYTTSMYGRTITIKQPTRADSGIYQCEAVFARPGATPTRPVTAEASLIVDGQYPL
jgi:hypothetical protein